MEEALPSISSSLDFTISIPGSSSGDHGGRRETGMRNLDINKAPEDEGKDEQEYTNIITLNSSSHLSMDLEKQLVNEEGSGSVLSSSKKHRLSKQQVQLLEDSFRLNHSIDMKQKEALAMKLQLRPRQVEVWFQNRRARSKLKQREMECEYLRKWFTSLTEQNRCLQKEVDELRALEVVPPPSVLLCPRCHLSTASCHSRTDHLLDGTES